MLPGSPLPLLRHTAVAVAALLLLLLTSVGADATPALHHLRGRRLHLGCKRLLWFTAISGSNPSYKKYIRVAMMSHRDKAPSLIPHLLFSGASARDHPFLEWYQKMGGTVHMHNLSFYHKLQASVKAGQHDEGWLTQHGAYLRMDLPLVLKGMQLPGDVEPDHVLYTDADVVFFADLNSCNFPKPPILAIGPEWNKGLKVNSGVLYINVPAFARDKEQLVQWGEAHGWPGLFDQTIITAFYGERLTLLPDKYNWKPYWGWTPDLAIVHLHGPKPEKCLDCLALSRGERWNPQHCNCPPIYMWLWSITPDKGEFYAHVLLKYYKYLLHSHEIIQ